MHQIITKSAKRQLLRKHSRHSAQVTWILPVFAYSWSTLVEEGKEQ